MSAAWRLWWRLWLAQWRASPVRMLVPLLGIALGVALASAVQLVNRSALEEFEHAARRLAGDADFVVRGPEAGFAENLYPEVARTPGVAVASPVLELRVSLPDRRESLPLVALDVFRATQVQPALLAEVGAQLRALFAPDGIFLSAAAAAALDVDADDHFDVLVGSSLRRLHVIGRLGEAAFPRALGIMDIAAAQWQFDRLGVINRIDVRVAQGASAQAVRSAIERRLPPGVTIAAPAVDSDRLAAATRAYRVNLGMLALVAVLTGAFLVFATQALSILRRRSALALLRALGVTRAGLRRALAAEGLALGVAGAAIGVACGQLLAGWMSSALAGDLGAGQLAGASGTVSVMPAIWAAYIVLGAVTAGFAAWLPAREAAARPVARALKAGDAESALAHARPWRTGVVLIGSGALLAWLPALRGLPLFGYAAIAALLFGGVMLVPTIAERVLTRLPTPRRPTLALAIAQLRGSGSQTAIGLVAIIVSFSLMVAMAIMVHSFRESFVGWLDQVVPADLQLRVGQNGGTATLDAAQQAALARLAGVTQARFRRTIPLSLRRGAAPVTVIAAPIDAQAAGEQLALLRSVTVAAGTPLWVSEAMVDLYGWQPGARVTLPLGRGDRTYTVAGVYRDYGRSSGSVVIPREDYVAASGDRSANEALFWLQRNASPAAVAAAMRAQLDLGEALQVRTTTEVRDLSLASFDRAFAITYALEAIAVLIGLLGVAVTAASTALARRGEFGMLRHIGVLRRQIVAMLAGEGLLTSAIGVACALVLGGALSLVLVYVVNRQSFLWSIDLAVPWWQLAALATALIGAAAITATISGRAAVSGDAVRAVREDW